MTPWATSRSVSSRSSPSRAPVRCIELISSSRSSVNSECSASSGPNSSSSRSSHSASSAARASSANGDGGRSAPRSERCGYASVSDWRARVIATCSSRRIVGAVVLLGALLAEQARREGLERLLALSGHPG